jgi:hypothetical protein
VILVGVAFIGVAFVHGERVREFFQRQHLRFSYTTTTQRFS